jgi:cephalosporin-C deacetylase-like acetyl esterase
VPVIEYAKELQADDEKLLRAVLLSDLLTIHMKTGIGRLSAYCGAVSAGCGAAAGIDTLRQGAPEPKDFDAFWKSQRELLNKEPMKAVLTPFKSAATEARKVNVWDVQITVPGGFRGVSGYLSIPADAKPKSLPAIVYYHAAGVRSSYARVAPRAILFDVNAHGIPNGQSKEYYNKRRYSDLKNYPRIGQENRDTVYFRGMFLRMLRTLDYVKSRPEWDGKVLVVTGGSMGGGQSIAAAALDPQVTLVVAGVPAIGDHGGNLAPIPRRPGWPQYYYAKTADSKVVKATSYYDNVFFARRVKCEVYLTTGLIDRTCPPTSVWLYFKNLKTTKKNLEVYPCGDHGGAPQNIGQKRIREILTGKSK